MWSRHGRQPPSPSPGLTFSCPDSIQHSLSTRWVRAETPRVRGPLHTVVGPGDPGSWLVSTPMMALRLARGSLLADQPGDRSTEIWALSGAGVGTSAHASPAGETVFQRWRRALSTFRGKAPNGSQVLGLPPAPLVLQMAFLRRSLKSPPTHDSSQDSRAGHEGLSAKGSSMGPEVLLGPRKEDQGPACPTTPGSALAAQGCDRAPRPSLIPTAPALQPYTVLPAGLPADGI